MEISVYVYYRSRSHNTEVGVCNIVNHKHLQTTSVLPNTEVTCSPNIRAFPEHVRRTGNPRQAQASPGARLDSRKHCSQTAYVGVTSGYFIWRSASSVAAVSTQIPSESKQIEPESGETGVTLVVGKLGGEVLGDPIRLNDRL